MDDQIQGFQQKTHYPKEKLPKIITHNWKFGNLLEAPNTLPMKDLFVTKFKSKENWQLQNYKKSPQFRWLFSLLCFNQFGVLLSPIALKVVGPFFLTQILQGMALILLPISYMATHKQGNKKTSNNQRQKKMK